MGWPPQTPPCGSPAPAPSLSSCAFSCDGYYGLDGCGPLFLTVPRNITGLLRICTCGGDGTLEIRGGSFTAGFGTLLSGGTLAGTGGGTLVTEGLASQDAVVRIDGAGSVATVT